MLLLNEIVCSVADMGLEMSLHLLKISLQPSTLRTKEIELIVSRCLVKSGVNGSCPDCPMIVGIVLLFCRCCTSETEFSTLLKRTDHEIDMKRVNALALVMHNFIMAIQFEILRGHNENILFICCFQDI